MSGCQPVEDDLSETAASKARALFTALAHTQKPVHILSWGAFTFGQGAAGVLTIPGFTHPVRDLFLEDVLEATRFAVGRSSKWAAPKRPAAEPAGTKARVLHRLPLWSLSAWCSRRTAWAWSAQFCELRNSERRQPVCCGKFMSALPHTCVLGACPHWRSAHAIVNVGACRQ